MIAVRVGAKVDCRGARVRARRSHRARSSRPTRRATTTSLTLPVRTRASRGRAHPTTPRGAADDGRPVARGPAARSEDRRLGTSMAARTKTRSDDPLDGRVHISEQHPFQDARNALSALVGSRSRVLPRSTSRSNSRAWYSRFSASSRLPPGRRQCWNRVAPSVLGPTCTSRRSPQVVRCRPCGARRTGKPSLARTRTSKVTCSGRRSASDRAAQRWQAWRAGRRCTSCLGVRRRRLRRRRWDGHVRRSRPRGQPARGRSRGLARRVGDRPCHGCPTEVPEVT
jgi:hypothetical protein